VDRGNRKSDGMGRKGGKRGRKGRRNGETKKSLGIVFRNIAGSKRKDRDFWDFLERIDIIDLCET